MNTKKLILISFCMMLVTSTALADWDPQDGHKMHYPQLPDPCGFDVAWMNVWALGDDWECSATGPVEDIHFWVSFQDGQGTPDNIQNFNIEIWSNNPGDPNIFWSHPEQMLWMYPHPTFTWQYVDTDWQGWYDPYWGDWWTFDHVGCYQINVENIPDPFIQQEGEIYWLVINDVFTDEFINMGWKESNDHFMDNAVLQYMMPWWEELYDPEIWEPMDLAFVITGEEEPEPGIKWSQPPVLFEPPDIYIGWDEPSLEPWWVMALDDFRCDSNDPVTAIRWWGSLLGWYDDTVPFGYLPDAFYITIWTDTPAAGPGEPVDKWIQEPDLTEAGMDLDVTEEGEPWFWASPHIAADDFQCWQTGPITDISIWGSWVFDMPPGDPTNVWFTVSIHANNPMGPGGYSEPIEPALWSRDFYYPEFDVSIYADQLFEYYWLPCDYSYGDDSICWQYDFHMNPGEAFVQCEGEIYWLDVQAHVMGNEDQLARFGWKTSWEQWNDYAVYACGYKYDHDPWYIVTHPFDEMQRDLAFMISGPYEAYSHPNEVIWATYCYEYDVGFYGWEYDPMIGTIDLPKFEFYQEIPTEEYWYQPEDSGIYWLGIMALYDEFPDYPWGWETRPHYFQDDAVRLFYDYFPDIGTQYPPESYEPIKWECETWDLSFELITEEEPNIPEPKDPIPHLKWSQPPIEIDPTADTPTYCGWDEASYREFLPYQCPFECWEWPCQCHGDGNNDCMINAVDVLILKDAWGGVYPDYPYDPCADYDRDYVVGIKDLVILKTYWMFPPEPNCPPCGGEPAPGEQQYFDLFAVSLSPNDVYWNLVEGGSGTLTDPLVTPDPAPVPVISTSPYPGITWGFGGLDWGDGVLESDAGSYSIESTNEPNYYLSVVLDTDTLPQHDDTMSSWGTISNIVVTPGTPGNWGAPIEPTWVVSPFDPDGGTAVISGLSSTVTLAGNNFGDPEINLVGQPMGIWGAAAELPPDTGYKVEFDTDVYTWDSYDAIGPQPLVPTVSWQIAADDFRCLGTMPVTSVHWWGSHLGWEDFNLPPVQPDAWIIGFWSNVPAGFDTWYSHPGELLWQVEARIPRVEIEYVGEDYFPDMPAESCFQYHVEFLQEERFWQHEFLDQTSDDIFWLSIAAIYDPCVLDIEYPWGWKTRPWSWMDDAVRFHLDEDPYDGMVLEPSANIMEPIEDPCYYESFDLAFELDTDPNFIKWEQAYDSIRHWPHYEDQESMAIGDVCEPSNIIRLVADDWPCDTNGAVSAVVWWGSYLGFNYEACQGPPMDLPIKPDYFWLGIWTDTPADPNIPGSFSHPDDLIWEYKAYDYDEVLVGYDKYPEYEPPFRTEAVFRYSVRIPDEEQFCQEQADGIYWLSVVAVYEQNIPNYYWGWTNHEHVSPPPDDAVAGYLDFYSEWTWEELYDQTGYSSIDMSFMLFTECLSCSSPEYADWVAWGKPRCWCYPRQCRGDINGLKTMMKWVQGLDLDIFRAAFLKPDAALGGVPNGICADLNHTKTMMKRVQGLDLDIFRAYFLQPEANVPLCDIVDPNFLFDPNDPNSTYSTGPYNFWVYP